MKSYIFLPFVAIFFSFSFLCLANAHNTNQEGSSSALHSKYKGYFSKVYAFGDSYTDTGNAHLLGGLVSSSNAENSASDSTKSSEYPNRLCNGRLIIDFLCEALSLPPLPPYRANFSHGMESAVGPTPQATSFNFSHGVNFAVAGSTALSGDYFVQGKIDTLILKKTPMSFQTQIDWFNKFRHETGCGGKNQSSCKTEMENALFWLGEMGVNDYSRAINSSVPLRWLAERSVIHAIRLLKTLLDGGAKYAVVEGLPPIGCLPVGISLSPVHDRDHMGCASVVNTAVMIHNQILQRKLKNFRTMYPKSTILYADNWNAYLTILTNPKKYKFQEAFKTCCGAREGKLNFKSHSLCGSAGTSICKDPSKYIIWDGIHLTEAMNHHLADLFVNQGFCRPSFAELIKRKSGM